MDNDEIPTFDDEMPALIDDDDDSRKGKRSVHVTVAAPSNTCHGCDANLPEDNGALLERILDITRDIPKLRDELGCYAPLCSIECWLGYAKLITDEGWVMEALYARVGRQFAVRDVTSIRVRMQVDQVRNQAHQDEAKRARALEEDTVMV